MGSARMLEELRRAGRHVVSASFELDAEQAREKLARYQLVDPHRYVLQFVQAATLLGAENVVVTVDADEFELTHDGDGPTRDQLANIYLGAFAGAEDDHTRALRHLAIGLIASQAVEPDVVEVDSHTETASARLVVAETESVTDLPSTPASRQRIYLRESFRATHLVEFFRRFGGRYAEVSALNDARFAPLKLTVNGERLSAGSEPRDAAAGAVDTPYERGYLTLDGASRHDGSVAMVQHGVLIERMRLDVGNLEVGGVVETRRLATNLSHSGFVRSEAWHELHDEVLLPIAMRLFARRFDNAFADANRPFVADVIAAALRARSRLLSKHRALPPEYDHAVMQLADVRVWRCLPEDETGDRYLSTRELLHQIGDGAVPFSATEHVGLTVRDDAGAIVPRLLYRPRRSREPLGPELLASATGRETADLTHAVQEAYREQVLRGHGTDVFSREGLVGTWPPRLGESFGATGRTSRGPVSVEVGVPATSVDSEPRLLVVLGQHTLARLSWHAPSLRHLTVLLVDEAASGTSAEILVRDHVDLIAEAATRMVVRQGGALRANVATPLLLAMLNGEFAAQLAAEMGAKTVAEGKTVKRIRSLGQTSSVEVSRLGAVADADLFEEILGRWLSLSEIAQRPVIEYVPATLRGQAIRLQHAIETTGIGQEAVWLDPTEYRLLCAVFGANRLRDTSEAIRVAASRFERERSGLREEAVLHGTFSHHRVLRGEGVEGELGLSQLAPGNGDFEVIFLHRQRRLTRRVLPHRLARLRAVVQSPSLKATPDLTDIVEDHAFEELMAHLTDLADALVEQALIEGFDDDDEDVERCIWAAVAESARTGESPHRLDWPVFPLDTGRRVSHREVIALSPRGKIHFATGDHSSPGAPVVTLPVAAPMRVALLKELFAEYELVDCTSHRIEVAEERGSEQLEPETRDDDPLTLLLAAANVHFEGVVVSDVERVRMVGEQIALPRGSVLARAHAKAADRQAVAELLAVTLLARRRQQLLVLAQNLPRHHGS